MSTRKVLVALVFTLAFASLPTAYVFAAESLPGFVFKIFSVAEESDREVHALIKRSAKLVYPEPRQARKGMVEALRKVDSGASIDLYDYLWTYYGLLNSSFESGTAEYGPGTQEDYIKVARHALKILDKHTSTGIWHYTELGAFQKEVYRTAGNGLAWEIYETSDDSNELEEALQIINHVLDYARGEEDYYMYDTKVRLLIKLGKEKEAFEVVKAVLESVPDFGDFQDSTENTAYQEWLKKK